ncbi:MAG: lipoic acid synthetase [Candidatus Krumholzibacteriia bacterium]|jgi:lipoic acid synthetase
MNCNLPPHNDLVTDLNEMPVRLPKPPWLKIQRQGGAEYNNMKRLIRTSSLNTVCESANCPNRGECFSSRTATFMLLGNVCTRHCTFCNIPGGRVLPVDSDEPRRVAEAVAELELKFAVVTAVNRDDLPDGGAAHFAATIRQIRRHNPGCGVEVLIPDFMGDPLALEKVLSAAPEVLNHNLETAPRLYQEMRPQAVYLRSLQVLKRSRQWSDDYAVDVRIKTGIMVGVGETHDEVVQVMHDALDHGVQIMTIGQYLQPSAKHHPVLRYVDPAEFDEYAKIGLEMGLEWVESGPMVRSSYHAREQSDGVVSDTKTPAAASAPRAEAG